MVGLALRARTPAESPQPPNALRRARRRSLGEQDSTCRASFVISSKSGVEGSEVTMSKSSDKPRKQQKQKPQKTLKERRSEKRAARSSAQAPFSRQANEPAPPRAPGAVPGRRRRPSIGLGAKRPILSRLLSPSSCRARCRSHPAP